MSFIIGCSIGALLGSILTGLYLSHEWNDEDDD